ncbi:copper resistance protein B [Cellvibrio sp.]|uniref:copper resistance protein B n=1 Tax=Cellvibrio sp. TaxID=1965322 RepID=UPI0039648AFA
MKANLWKKRVLAMLIPVSLTCLSAYGHESDDPVLTRVLLDQFELSDGDNNPVNLEAQAWIGKSLNKLWLKTEVARSDGQTQDAEVQALYSHAIAPFWDAQIGVRHDIKPRPSRDWGVIGIQGLSPYWFDVDAAFFVGESGRIAARLKAEYELLITQRLILSPSFEVNLYGQNDGETATGSGVSDTKAGLRLRYEIHRELAPYVGINWNKKFGKTAEFAKAEGESFKDTELVAGLRIWF